MDGFLWVTDSLVWGGGWPGYHRMFRSGSGPCSFYVGNTHSITPTHIHTYTTPSLWQQKHLYTLPNVPGVKTAPLLRTSVLKKKKRFLVITKNFFFFNPLSICQHDSLLPAHPMGHKWPICVNLWHLVTNVLSSNPKLPQTTHKCPEYCASCFLFLAVTDGPTPSLCLSPEHGAMAPSALMK